MDNSLRWLKIIIVIIVLSGLMGGSALAQTSDIGEFFPDTGHTVVGDFLEKYQSIPNGKEIYGDPITNQFFDERSGLTVQYFEKARFELHPEASVDLRVQLTPLGEYLYTFGEAVQIPSSFPACRFYRETGYSICYTFLEFFENNGSISQFGYPISNFEIHNGWISQYFQRARLEWHPERSIGERVVVADLGTDYFYFREEDPKLLQPDLEDNASKIISDLQVHAFVSKPFLPLLGNSQELYVIVYDQNYTIVENVIVSYAITLPSGNIIDDSMQPTNTRGLSVQQLMFPGETVGTAKIVVTATYGTLQKQTRTSFQIW